MTIRQFFAAASLACTLAWPVHGEVITPDSDERDHASFELENGLTVMVVSDPGAETAAAAMSVGVGSDDDPDQVPGLAHLLEHMVFSGSEAYPERGGFSDFINRQGGRYNGYTASDHSSFFFEVQPDALDKALKRFSDFLAQPTLDREDVDREIQIVQHEYDGQKNQQGWQELSVFRKVVNPAHPFSRFNMGNRASFEGVARDTLMKELKELFEAHYRAGDMKLVVQGAEPVAGLRKRVKAHFSDLPEGSAPDSDLPPLLPSDELPRWVRVGGDGSDPRMVLSFPVAPPHKAHRVLPYGYIGELITSKQAGRLREALRERGWISDLGASHRVNAGQYATFDITLLLTDEGVANRKAVTGMVHDYLDRMREDGVSEPLYREQQRSIREAFHNAEQPPAMHYVSRLAGNLQRYEPERVLSGPSLMQEYDEAVIREALDQLRPANMVVTSYIPDTSWEQEDAYSGATFETRTPTTEKLEQWLALEAAPDFWLQTTENPYIQEEHPLVDRNLDQEQPSELAMTADREGFDVWFLQDQQFESPKGALYMALDHPVAYEAEHGPVTAGVYSMVLNEALKPLIQKGDKAGLSVTAMRTNHGVGFRIYGFTGKQKAFVSDVLDRVRNVTVTQELLDKAMAGFEQQVNQYRNFQPFQKLVVSLRAEAHPRQSRPDRELTAAESVTVDQLKDFHERLWDRPSVEALMHGNYDRDSARAMARVLSKGIGGPFETMPNKAERLGDAAIPREKAEVIPGDNTAAVYYARQPLEVEHSAELAMLAHMLNQHLFSAVRDKQPMGYVAFATPTEDYRSHGPVFGIQAPGASPKAVRKRLDSEVERFVSNLEGMSESDFDVFRDGLLSKLQKPQERLRSYSHYWWKDIRRFGKPVDELGRATQQLKALSADELTSFARKLLLDEEARVLVRTTGA
ncbi:insulinase family protein [Halomonadaceae bacterium KBTZ08]